MTSQSMTEIAAPVWGTRRTAHAARAISRRSARVARGQPAGPRPLFGVPQKPLELRVQGGARGTAAVGVLLAAGFALLWAFLLLGVVAPAGTLG